MGAVPSAKKVVTLTKLVGPRLEQFAWSLAKKSPAVTSGRKNEPLLCVHLNLNVPCFPCALASSNVVTTIKPVTATAIVVRKRSFLPDIIFVNELIIYL